MSDPRMLWVADEDAPGGVSPIPASPLLIPALALWGAIKLFGVWGARRRTVKRYDAPCPDHVDPVQYAIDLERACDLNAALMTQKNGEFGHYVGELYRLEHPEWNNGEKWVYFYWDFE